MPWKKVWRNVLLGLPGKPERAVAERALAEVGLGDHADAWPKTLSGGEAQRASLARALVREPDLLLLDEPFGALDALTRIKAQRLVGELWQRRGCAVLLVTHDVEEAVLLADRVLVMDDGVIAHEQRIDLDRPRDITDPGSPNCAPGSWNASASTPPPKQPELPHAPHQLPRTDPHATTSRPRRSAAPLALLLAACGGTRPPRPRPAPTARAPSRSTSVTRKAVRKPCCGPPVSSRTWTTRSSGPRSPPVRHSWKPSTPRPSTSAASATPAGVRGGCQLEDQGGGRLARHVRR